MSEHRLDREVREVVAREERGVAAALPLPRRRAVGSNAGQRRAAIGVLGEPDGEHGVVSAAK
jgi:hypothetical protein